MIKMQSCVYGVKNPCSTVNSCGSLLMAEGRIIENTGKQVLCEWILRPRMKYSKLPPFLVN